MTQLSFISVNYRAFEHLRNALKSLQDNFQQDWEFIVVDNESSEPEFLAFQAEFPWVKCIANPLNSGFGGGCRIGVEQASGEHFFFINPDVIATAEDINKLLAIKQRHTELGILTPQQRNKQGHFQKVCEEFPAPSNQVKWFKALRRLLGQYQPVYETGADGLSYCDWVTGSAILIAKEDYEKAGGWSPEFWMYGEDADLCRKVTDTGKKVAMTEDVDVVHIHGGSSRINVAVKIMTKLEVIISKHIYSHKHFSGLRRLLMHALIASTRLPVLALASIVNLLTAGRIPQLQVQWGVFKGLIAHYLRVVKTGSWASHKLLELQNNQ